MDFKLRKPPGGKLPAGASKLFGNPDVPGGFVWPTIPEDQTAYDLSFIGQIDCGQFALFHPGSRLPESGMLYFFYDLDAFPRDPCAINAARVLFYNCEKTELCEMILTDESGEALGFPELEICAEGDIGVCRVLPEGAPPTDGRITLFEIGNIETDDISLRFEGGTLRFLIEPEKLLRSDISDVRIIQGGKP